MPDGTEGLARQALETSIRRYFAMCRERIPGFIDRHFSLRGTLGLHRAALGWDIACAPVNLVLAAPAAGLHVAATAAHRLGAQRVANWLGRRGLLLRTSVADRIGWLIRTELLEQTHWSVRAAQELLTQPLRCHRLSSHRQRHISQ